MLDHSALLRLCVSFLIAVAIVPPVHAQTTLRLQFKKGDKLHYVLEQELVTTAVAQGKTATTKAIVIWDVAWEVLDADTAGAQMQITIERARMFMAGPAGKAAADSADKNEPEDAFRKGMYKSAKIMAAIDLRGTMLPTGAIERVKTTDAAIKAIKELGGPGKEEDIVKGDIARTLLAQTVLPSDPVAKGKTWSSKTETKSGVGKLITDHTFTYDGPIDADGVKLEKIAIKSSLKLEPDAKAPAKVTLKDFKGTGHTLIDNASGRLIETTTSQRTELQLEAMGMTGTQTMEQTVTMRLKKK